MKKTARAPSALALSKSMIDFAKRLHQRSWLAATDGDISYRLSDNKILITPEGASLEFLRPEQMAVITLENKILKGTPSKDRLLHLEIYRNSAKAKAVVRAKPPTALAWTIARPDLPELPAQCSSDIILSAGSIPFVPYARTGSEDMVWNLLTYLPRHRALLLSRHSALAWGEDLEEAYGGIERIEHAATVLAKAVQLGGLNSLPVEDLMALREMKETLGERLL